MEYFKNFNKIVWVSYGVLYVLFTLWLIFHPQQVFPEGNPDDWFKIFISYGVVNALIFGLPNIRKRLFEIQAIKILPKITMYSVLFLMLYMAIINKVDPLQSSNFAKIALLDPWLIFIHALVFATTESVFWQGYLDFEIGHPWSELTAGLFHWGVWGGSLIVVVLGAGALFAWFSYTQMILGKDQNDLSPAIGNHTGFNLAKLIKAASEVKM